MEQKKLGCLTRGGYLALIATLLGTSLVFAVSGSIMFSPGELNAQVSGTPIGGISSHSELENDCKQCHPAPWDQMDQADLCLDCHQEISDELSDTQTLHGAIQTNRMPFKCRDCHGEHLGKEASLTAYSGEGFPHELVAFSLIAHTNISWSREIICQDCHLERYADFDSQTCSNCHLDIHPVLFEGHLSNYGANCLDCHDGLETIYSSYDHNQTSFDLTGSHLDLSCASCHRWRTSLAQFGNSGTDCVNCHALDDPHQLSLGSSCKDCHTPDSWDAVVFDHAPAGFVLDGSHLSASCLDCHKDLAFPEIQPECIFCHGEEEPHQGLFGKDCTACHTTMNWTVTSFDHSSPYTEFCSACHQDDSPEIHYTAECSACHSTESWLPASFNHAAEGATDCLACHTQDSPSGHFPGQCSLCHSTRFWKPSTINHTFPTSHGDASNRCNLCHPGANYYTYSCYECHEHSRSEIRSEHENISNLDNCLRCHWDGRKHEDGDDDDD